MNFRKYIKKLFVETVWCVAYRRLDCEKGKYKVIKTPRRYWCADPFLLENAGKSFIIAEMEDRNTSYARLGVCCLDDDNPRFEIIADLGCHTSYPCVFYENGWYMIPETSIRETVELYKAVDFPYKWKKIGTLKSGKQFVDTTVFRDNGKLKAFLYDYYDCGKKAKLYVANLDVNKCVIDNITEVVDYPDASGRPAGNVFLENEKNIRPTQYGVNFYGEKIEFFSYEIKNAEYSETKVYEITMNDIPLDTKQRFVGTHTYNKNEKYEVVDVRRYKFFIERPVTLVFKRLGIFGFKRGK